MMENGVTIRVAWIVKIVKSLICPNLWKSLKHLAILSMKVVSIVKDISVAIYFKGWWKK
jgi:hypothetical protein